MVLLIFACATGGDGSDAGFVIAIGVFDWLWFSGVMGLEVCVHGMRWVIVERSRCDW